MSLTNTSEKEPSHLTSFTLFPNLPSELRLQILEDTYVPRNVYLSTCRFQRKKSYRQILDPRSLFAHLLVNHEARELLLHHYPRIFVNHSQSTRKDQLGGWYFNYNLDSLCMVSGVRGLKFFLDNYTLDMSHVRYLDVQPAAHALVGDDAFRLLGTKIELRELKDLEIVTIRNITTRRRAIDAPNPDYYYHSYTLLSLMNALCRDKKGKLVGYAGHATLAAQFHWLLKDDDIFQNLKRHLPGGEWSISDDVRDRWDLVGVSPPDANCPESILWGATVIPIASSRKVEEVGRC